MMNEQQNGPIIVNVADLVDPNDAEGRTYRQINAAMQHNISVNTLVELDNGCRLFVVWHGRDCDQTPLYYLGADKDDTEQLVTGRRNPGWNGGYSEESLKVLG